MVTELIDHIDVYHAERVDGEDTQRVVPYYHCIGAFEVPDWKDIPEIDILIETRKGVALSYVIDELPKAKTTGFDVICDALQETRKATGERFFVHCDGSTLNLIKRTDNVIQWVIGAKSNLNGYTYSKNIENIKTRLNMLDHEDKVIAQRVNYDLEAKIGIMQEIQSADSKMSTGKLNELADSTIKKISTPERWLSVDAVGQTDIITGVCVYAVIPHLELERTFYVESDNHTFMESIHTMQLTLLETDED